MGPWRVIQLRMLDRVLPLYKDEFTFGTRLFQAALENISARVEIYMFDVQILHIKTKVCDAPCNPVIVTDNDTWHARYRCSHDIQTGRLQMRHVPRRREIVEQMRIVRQNRLAG